MYNKVLVPISFDEERDAQGAMEIAKLVCAEGGSITCLHVVEQVPQFAAQYLPEGHLAAKKAEISDELEELVAGVENTTAAVAEGHPSRTILEYAKNHEIDLIIVASHRPGMQDYLLGSTAAKVVRHAPCAVHVLR